MSPHPLRLLVSGYAFAAAGALLLYAALPSVVVALLVFWIGGAVATLALAVLPGVSRPFRLSEGVEEAALAAELRRWEEDRRAEAAEAVAASRREAAD